MLIYIIFCQLAQQMRLSVREGADGCSNVASIVSDEQTYNIQYMIQSARQKTVNSAFWDGQASSTAESPQPITDTAAPQQASFSVSTITAHSLRRVLGASRLCGIVAVPPTADTTLISHGHVTDSCPAYSMCSRTFPAWAWLDSGGARMDHRCLLSWIAALPAMHISNTRITLQHITYNTYFSL